MQEVFKDVPNYEGLYQVSNLGRVKSLPRVILNKGKHPFLSNEKIRRPTKDGKGYLQLLLAKQGKKKNFKVHKLVAMAFLSHTPCGMNLVVDHINNDRLNNRLDNLQIISNRENSSKDLKNKTSKYTGVSWCKLYNKWVAQIQINGKRCFLGYFKCELAAAVAYQNKLKELV